VIFIAAHKSQKERDEDGEAKKNIKIIMKITDEPIS
jgi:hypothetical protein